MQVISIDDNPDKAAFYRDLAGAVDGLTQGEPDPIANMANTAAILWEYLPNINWAGFYRLLGDELVLGPFQGKNACIRIAVGQGVCGTAAATLETQCVDNVEEFPGHIPCDAASASELVVPVIVDGALVAVLDIDSPSVARFDQLDIDGIEAIVAVLGPRLFS
jgi:GAF domain-containing protein